MNPTNSQFTTQNKALQVNLDECRYGTFAEIGAGQEVARHFFQAGRASQTIAKTISAYDMIYSDEIYGKEKSGRYVCESRLSKMLDKEFSLLLRRLQKTRGDKTCFFAFADTVATGSENIRYCHGWMGVRYQTNPNSEPQDIVMHVRMLDKYRLQQQETLGVLGVNLVHAAFYHTQSINDFLDALTQNIKAGQIAIDMIKVSGSELKHIDNRLLNLELVNRELVDCILFDRQGQIVNASDELFNKSLLIQRGKFQPVTNTHIDIFQKGFEQFKQENKITDEASSLALFEISTNQIMVGDQTNEQDFLNRVDSLALLNQYVLISNYPLFYQLKIAMTRFTKKPVSMVIGANLLERIFDESHYKELQGGLLEGMAKLLDEKTKLYVYPYKTKDLCLTLKSFFPNEKYKLIFEHFKQKKQIVDISGCDDAMDYYRSEDVRKMILEKKSGWEKHVPEAVAKKIKTSKFFNY